MPDASVAALGRRMAIGAVGVALLAGIAAVVMAVVVRAAGFASGPALTSLWTGAFGSLDALLSVTLVRTVPLLLVGIGMVVALRAGVINLGGDGQLLSGAVAGTWVALSWPDGGFAAIVVAMLAAGSAGALWTVVPAWLKIRFGTLEVVSTIMMNFVAMYGVSFLVRGPLQEPTGIYPQSANVTAANQLPLLFDGSRLHAGIILAVAVAVVAWVVLEQTATGFRLRAVGTNVRAAAMAGRIDVGAVQRNAFLASGALAGLAGCVEVLGVTFALYENLSPGYGYSAIAVALLAKLGPLRAIASALLLGALAAGATAMQRDAGIPVGAAVTVEAALILAVLGGQVLLTRWQSRDRPPRVTS